MLLVREPLEAVAWLHGHAPSIRMNAIRAVFGIITAAGLLAADLTAILSGNAATLFEVS